MWAECENLPFMEGPEVPLDTSNKIQISCVLPLYQHYVYEKLEAKVSSVYLLDVIDALSDILERTLIGLQNKKRKDRTSRISSVHPP